MKICLVTAFPPSRRGLNEYGFHIARELRRDPLLSLTILADELDGPVEELPDYDVIRCWRFDSLSNPGRLLKVFTTSSLTWCGSTCCFPRSAIVRFLRSSA